MSVAPKITNGDISFLPGDRKIAVVANEEKALQLAVHTISFDTRVDGKGAGLRELVGRTRNSVFLRAAINESIKTSFGNVIEDQYRTPSVLKTRKELIEEVRDLIITRSEDDPRNYDIELTVVLLDGQTFSISGILS